MAKKDIPVIMIRPTHRFITAVGELEDITDDDARLDRAQIIDCGEIKEGETALTAAQRKREKYRYEERFTRPPDS